MGNKYTKIGYYNGLDAVMMYDMTADEIVKNMHENKGMFYHVSDEPECEHCEFEPFNEWCNEVMTMETTDKKYIVRCDNCSHLDNIPFDIIDQQNLSAECFIDIYEKIIDFHLG